MTLELVVADELWPAFIACAVLASRPPEVCTRCREVTDDVRVSNGSRLWPCRPCRREQERMRRELFRRRSCSVAGCTGQVKSLSARFCRRHRPSFG